MHRILLCVFMAIVISATLARAQEPEQEPQGDETTTRSDTLSSGEIKEQLDGVNDRLILLENDVDKLKSIRISGYVQAEWQHFDQSTSAGGRAVYSDARKNLFTIRRGRIKFQHRLGTLMSYTIQPDITERGVEIKDAYAEFNILPEGLFMIDIGMFNRPNYEVELSSSNRESVERAQVTRAFYPGERDLGILLSTQSELFENFNPKFQLGIFNGPGAPRAETDAYKDIIARVTFPLPLGGDSPLQVDLGASFYYGGMPQLGDSVIKTVGDANKTVFNDETGNLAGWGNAKNFNIESQIYLDLLPFGGTILKGEFMSGSRPFAGTASTPASIGIGKDTADNPIPVVVAARAGTPMQIRNQMGYYAYFIQNIGTELQLVAKYDYFDRNSDLSGEQARTADAASGVLGFGVNAFIDNMRITAFYEIPTYASSENAARNSSGAITSTDDVKDNKTTIRFQYKF